MAFEGLTEKLSSAFKKLRGKGRLSESDVKEAMREIRLALLEADVSYKVVKEFIKKVTERAVGADVLESLTPAQMIVKIVNEELTALMGGQSTKLNLSPKPPTVVMLVGPQRRGQNHQRSQTGGVYEEAERQAPSAGRLRYLPPRCYPPVGGRGRAVGHSRVSDGADRPGGYCQGSH